MCVQLVFSSRTSNAVSSGINFVNDDDFYKTLGYLSNPKNYRNINPYGLIKITQENNQLQGAYASEGRIAYYGKLVDLSLNFPALYNARSKGVGNINCRINNNEFINYLQSNFGFQAIVKQGYTTLDIIPPQNQVVVPLQNQVAFNNGYNL